MRIREIRNVQRKWTPIEEGYPEFGKPVLALVEFDTFHLDDLPYVERLIFLEIEEPNRYSPRAYWEIPDASEDEEPILTQDRFVVAWRYDGDF